MAKDLGIVMALHEADRLLPRALATSLAKRAMGDAGQLAALLDAKATAQALAFGSAYTQAATQRFLDKQPALFQWPKA